MPKRAISVTLEASNLLWLKARATAAKRRSVSELLDAIVSEARTAGTGTTGARSVVGTLDIAADDPDLLFADDVIREQFAASTARTWAVRETPPPYGSPRARRRRG